MKKKIDYLAELEKLIKKNNVHFRIICTSDKLGTEISADYAGNNLSSKRIGGSRDFKTLKNALDWIISGKEEE